MNSVAYLYIQHLKNSKKIIVVSSISLILSVAILSSTILFVDTTKQDIFAKTLNNTNSDYDITLEFNVNSPILNFKSITTQLNNITDTTLSDLNINFITNLQLFYASFNFYTGMKVVDSQNSGSLLNNSVIIIQLNNGLKNELANLSSTGTTFPISDAPIQQAFSLQTAFLNSSNPNLFSYENQNLLDKGVIKVFSGYNINIQTIKLNITGLGNFVKVFSDPNKLYNPLNYNSQKYPLLSKIWEHGSEVQTYLFVNNLTRVLSQIRLDSYGVYPIVSSFFGGYNIDLNKIDPFQISHKLSQIQTFQYTVSNKIYNSFIYQSMKANNPILRIDFPNYNIYQSLSNMVYSIFLNMFIYAVPIFLIAFFLTSYAFDSVHKEIVKLIVLFKTRGMTSLTILLFEVFDLGLVVALATIFGSLFGIPIASITTKTNFLLSFNFDKNYNVAQVFLSNIIIIFLSILAFAIVLNVILNLARIIRLSILSMNIDIITTEKKEPIWKKYYLDIIILFYGIFSYIVAVYINNSLIFNQDINSYTTIAIYLLIPSPFFIIIGLLLVINRSTPIILNYISKKLWNKQGGILAISFKKIVVQKSSSINGIILISCIIAFLILFYTLPYSEVNYRQNVSLYENGAEGVLTVNFFNHNSLQNVKSIIGNVSAILQYKYSNQLVGFSPYFTFQLTDYKIGKVVFIFVDSSTLLKSSSIDKFNLGLQNNLEKDLNTLHTERNSVIMNKQAFDRNLLSLNSNLTLYQYGAELEEFPIIDTYSIWPTTSRNTVQNTAYVISDMQTVLSGNLDNQSSLFSNVDQFGFYLKFNPNQNKTMIANQISSTLGYSVKISDVEIQNWDIYSAIIFQFQLGQINTNVIMSIIILIIILALFGLMQVNDTKREIFVEYALGLKQRQLGISILIQEISILLISFFIGTILGLSFIYILIIFITKGNQIPPYVIITPWDLVLVTYFCFLCITVIISAIIIRFVSKQDLASSIRNF